MDPNLAGGTFSFLQTISSYNSIVYKDGTKLPQVNQYAPKDVLDAPPPNAYMGNNWSSAPVGVGRNNVLISKGNGVPLNEVNDSPWMPAYSTAYTSNPQGNYRTELFINIHFHTYLIFKPPIGEAKAIANMDWEIVGDATFRDQEGMGGPSVAYYSNPQNWTIDPNVTVKPSQAGQQNGQASTEQPDSKGNSFDNITNLDAPL